MKQKFAAPLVVMLLLGTMSLKAQSSSSSTAPIDYTASNTFEVISEDNWTFYTDDERKIYYIDFENIDFNLSDIIVTDVNGEVVLHDDVLDLPVNTIYELDMSRFHKGIYNIELRSFTTIIRKEVAFE